ncbi:hypothetical protein WJX64_12525 [Leifsonia sp. YIM 134122]|uniref:Shikimate kinase n=1 Tax=Leifsonia stereocauli TaxID=3134136 RepID=A0ABU9W5W2_9MICO
MDLVFLHGPAAAGKLTTATALAELTGFAVFHNHLVVDTLLEVFPFGSPEFCALRESFWLQTFTAAAKADRSLIFTFTPEPTVSATFVGDAVSAVTAAGGRVDFVALAVSPAEQELRIDNPDRRRFNKLSSVDTLRAIRATESGEVSVPPAELVIDTEHSSPEESARLISTTFGLQRVNQPRGFLIAGQQTPDDGKGRHPGG